MPQDQVPLLVPESFWKGGSKLAWPTEDQALLYSSFPTFYVGFALHENSTMEFSLAVTPQVYFVNTPFSNDNIHDQPGGPGGVNSIHDRVYM